MSLTEKGDLRKPRFLQSHMNYLIANSDRSTWDMGLTIRHAFVGKTGAGTNRQRVS